MISLVSRRKAHRKAFMNIKKNGKKAATEKPAAAAPAVYPGEDVKQKKVTRKTTPTAPLRASITPGTVLILLAGRFRGKRVVFLKQLKSGLLLVTGPHKINGVPIRRVNQAYVIATSTKIDISKIKLDAKFTDEYFKHDKVKTEEKKRPDATRVADQKALDKQLLPLIKKVPTLSAYLNASFALSKGQFPHAIKY